MLYDELVKVQNVKLTEEELRNYMICLQKRLRYKESIEIAERLIAYNKDNSIELLNLCICYGKQGDYKKAIKYYERILKNNPRFDEQLGYYAYLLSQDNRLEESKKLYNIAINNEPDNAWYISHYALLLEQIGENYEAAEYLEKAISIKPNDTWIIKKFVFLYGKINGYKKAYEYYLNLIENNKENFNLFLNYAEYAIINNDVEYAKKILLKVKVDRMPCVLQMVTYFYLCFIALYDENKDNFETYKKLLYMKRVNYNAYIHRDFLLLNKFSKEKLSEENNVLYKQILKILEEGN